MMVSLDMCLTFKRGGYTSCVALAQQFYQNDAIYYKLTNFSAAAYALSLTEKASGEPNYADIERQVFEAQ